MSIGVRVVVTELATGESETTEIKDDFVLVTAGTCEMTSLQAHANGTVQITIKGRRRQTT